MSFPFLLGLVSTAHALSFDFEIAFAFVVLAFELIVASLSLILSKRMLIVCSFLDRSDFVASGAVWIWPPKKPPDNFLIPNSQRLCPVGC